ncbi:MAG: substrate-binding domain-containing protein [Alphaproteobacteria bacterium]|nr:substrate-binding domain-containing protein [Alphaproteobacteria bacterium]
MVEAWVKAFQKYQPGFILDIKHPLAGSIGALKLIKGDIDVVFVSRELKPTDISGFHAAFGYDPLSIPISGGTWRHFGFLDAVTFMVNPENPVSKLDFSQLDAAFSSTRWRGQRPVQTWGDLGLTGAWAHRPVHLYGIKPWNGFEEFVRQRVLSTEGHRGEWRSGIHYDSTFFMLARRVAADPDALGYTGLSAVDSSVKLVPLSIAPGGEAHSPDYESVAAASYPLSRVTYININARSGATLDPGLREFLRFILSAQGQSVVREQKIFLPLRAGQVNASLAQLERK